MTKLIKCNKPDGVDEANYVGEAKEIIGHMFLGVWVGDQYYEHDLTSDVWYKLIEVE